MKSLLLIPFLLLFSFSCQASKTTSTAGIYENMKRISEIKFSNDHYISGVGESRVGFEDAQAQAMVEIAKHIRSQIQHQFWSQEKYTESTGKNPVQENVLAATSDLTLTARFEHAELIQFDADSFVNDESGKYFVVGFIPRDDLKNLVAPKYHEAKASLEKTSENLIKNISDGDYPSVMRSYQSLQEQYRTLLQYGIELYVATAAYPPDKPAIESRYHFAVSKTLELKNKLMLMVTVSGEAALSLAMQKIIQKSLLTLKLKYQFHSRCKTKSPVCYDLAFDIKENCAWGNLGQVCQFERLQAELLQKRSRIFALDLKKDDLRGIHPTSRDIAREKLMERLETLSIDKDLSHKLAEYFINI